MKSIPKLIRRFVGIMTLSTILLVILNVTFFAVVFVKNISTVSPWDMADHVAAALQFTDHRYSVSEDVSARLKEEHAWAFLIRHGGSSGRPVSFRTISLCNTRYLISRN